jgi:hypothetical protein
MSNANPSRRICHCSARCGASGKAVSIATYNRHAQARHRDQFGAPLNALLASLRPEKQSASRGREAGHISVHESTRAVERTSKRRRALNQGNELLDLDEDGQETSGAGSVSAIILYKI